MAEKGSGKRSRRGTASKAPPREPNSTTAVTEGTNTNIDVMTTIWGEFLRFEPSTVSNDAWNSILDANTAIAVTFSNKSNSSHTTTTTSGSPPPQSGAVAGSACSNDEGCTAKPSRNENSPSEDPSETSRYELKFFLWNHCLQRLLAIEESKERVNVNPSLLTRLALSLALIVSQSSSKQPSTNSRSFVAQMLFTSIIAAMRGLKCSVKEEKERPGCCRVLHVVEAWVAGTLALESTMHWHRLDSIGKSEERVTSEWSTVRQSWETWLRQSLTTNDVVVDLVQSLSDLDWSLEVNFWNAMHAMTSSSANSSSPVVNRSTKRIARSKKGSSPSVDSSHIAVRGDSSALFADARQSLLDRYEAIRWCMDNRMMSRRWGGVFLYWYLSGSSTLLEIGHRLLVSNHDVNDVECLPPMVKGSRQVFAMYLAGSLTRTLVEMVKSAGTSPPLKSCSEEIEAFVKLVDGGKSAGASTTTRTSKKNVKKATQPLLPDTDLKSLAIVVAYHLVQTYNAACGAGDDGSRGGQKALPSRRIYGISMTAIVQDLARGSTSGSDQMAIDRIESAAVAYALQSQVIGDDLFSKFCVNKLSTGLDLHGDDMTGDLILSSPLPVPSYPPRPSKPRSASKSNSSLFAGVYDDRASPLSVILRAMYPLCYQGTLSWLIGLVENCYNNNICASAHLTGKAKQPKRKKQKNDKASSISVMCSKQMVSAKEVFNALEKCFQLNLASLSQATFRISLRSHATQDHLSRILALGFGARAFLKRVRPVESDLEASSSDEFSKEEKQLWTAYVNLCICIGRGQILYRSDQICVLGTSRHWLFAKVFELASRDKKNGLHPLCLCVPHLRLLAASSAGESIGDSAADDYFVHGCIKGISDAFTNLSTFQPPLPSPCCAYVEEIPLSLSFARLFCLSVARLSSNDRVKALSSLIDAVHSGLNSLGEPELSVLAKSAACAEFVGRVVAMAGCAAITFTCSSQLSYKLRFIVGTATPKCTLCSNWEAAERSFTSIFDDSVTSEHKEQGLHFTTMSKDVCERLQELLYRAFALGFTTASIDNSYLLFVAWINLGKSDLWITGKTAEVVPYKANTLQSEFSATILGLRSDIRTVSRLLCQANRVAYPLSCFQAIEEERNEIEIIDKISSLERAKQHLLEMITKAEILCDDLVSRFGSGVIDIPPEVFCLFEAIPSYLSFVVACHTQSEGCYFEYLYSNMTERRSQKRKKSISSDSDNYSDEDSVDTKNVVIDVSERFHSDCTAFGAVPCHPDWLDTECNFLDGVTQEDSEALSIRCIIVMTKITCLADNSDYKMNCESIVRPLEDVTLAVDLARIMVFGSGSVDSNLICKVTGIDSKILDAFSRSKKESQACRNRVHSRWLLDSAQNFPGHLQEVVMKRLIADLDFSELRGGYEWEMLFAGSLTSCALSTPVYSVDGFNDEMSTRAYRWHYVTKSAISGLIPATALLRFSSSGCGRKIHPLKLIGSHRVECCSSDVRESFKNTLRSDLSMRVVASVLGVVCHVFPYTDSYSYCEAVALNLLSDRKTFEVMRSVVGKRVAFSFLAAIHRRSSLSNSSFEELASLSRNISVVLDEDLSKNSGTSLNLALATNVAEESFVSILSEKLGVNETLRAWIPAHGPVPSSPETYTATLIKCLFPSSRLVFGEFRVSILRSLCSLATSDTEPSVPSTRALSIICSALNLCARDQLRLLVNHTFTCNQGNDGSLKETERRLLATLLSKILSVQGQSAFKFSADIVDIIRSDFFSWIENSNQTRVYPHLNFLLLFSFRCDEIISIVTLLFGFISDEKRRSIYKSVILHLNCIGSFIDELQAPFNARHGAIVSRPRLSLRRTCTHTHQIGFVNQHWYHCLTCGLTGDKGCCTLCALVCHAGHEVSFSRYSAFFCDCGAEGGPENTNSSLSCYCLADVPQHKVNNAVTAGRSELKRHLLDEKIDYRLRTGESSDISSCISIAQIAFPEIVQQVLNRLGSIGHEENWFKILFGVFMREFSELDFPITSCFDVATYNSMRLQMRYNTRNILVTTAEDDCSLIPLLHFKSGSFQLKKSSAVDSLKRAMNSSGGVCRRAIAIDYRGRAIVGESNTLTFCTFFPALCQGNKKPSFRRSSPLLQRSSASVYGSKHLDFNIVGLAICRCKDELLLMWGTHEVAVAVLNDLRSSLESFFDLNAGLVSDLESGSGVVSDCGWFPQSSSCIYVRCTRSISIFWINDNRSACLIGKIEAKSDYTFRGFTTSKLNKAERTVWKCHFLTDGGHLHDFEVEFVDDSYRISSLKFDPKQAIKLPLNDCVSSPGFSTSLGEGINLSYLEQSRVLLYQVVEEDVLAFPFGDDCLISSSFSLLSKTVTSGISGPFQHWTELGISSSGTSNYFRICCIGRRNVDDQVLLFIDFDHNETILREIPLKVSDFAFASPTVEGVEAFSCPFTTDQGFEERVVLAILLSNGSLQIFGEQYGCPTTASEERVYRHEIVPLVSVLGPANEFDTIPLLAFEGLTNAMDSDEVLIQSYGLGSEEEIHRKLLRDNEQFLAGTVAEGFNMTLRPKRLDGCDDNHVLVAFRFLVGSTSSASIPKRISVQGRDLLIKSESKKWYNVFLTQQEVAHAMRNGFVSIFVSETFDCCTNPVLDSVECFSCLSSSVSCWLPTSLRTIVPIRSAKSCSGDLFASASLCYNLETLAVYGKVFRPLQTLGTPDINKLRSIIADSALHCEPGICKSVDSILASMGWDDETRETFLDKALLLGCCTFLAKCQSQLSANGFPANIDQVLGPFRNCLRAASNIVATRPQNYHSVFEGHVTFGVTASAILIEFIKIIPSLALNLIADLIELCLLELAAAVSQNFEGIRRILDCDDSVVVKLGSVCIIKFCERHHAPSQNDNEGEHDLFPRQAKVSYCCDGCGLCPIKDIRFSFLEDHHPSPIDLCKTCYSSASAFATSYSGSATQQIILNGRPVGGDVKLTCLDISSMHAVNAEGETLQRQEVFCEFLEGLFSHVLDLAMGNEFSSSDVLSLLLAIVYYSSGFEKAKRLLKQLIKILSRCLSCDSMIVRMSFASVGIMRALIHLTVLDEDASIFGSDREEVDDNATLGVRLIREAPRLKKDRNDFCCSNHYLFQCELFQWDEDLSGDKPHLNEAICKLIWDELQPVLSILMDWISLNMHDHQRSEYIQRAFNFRQFDVACGAMCSRLRLQDFQPEILNTLSHELPEVPSHEEAVDVIVLLLALVASPKKNVLLSWSPILCKIIAKSSKVTSHRAKRALLRLCGTKARYVTLRAHNAFSKNRERLAIELVDIIYAGLAIREKSRQCGLNWKDERKEDASHLKAGDLLGTEDLISEDVITPKRLDAARKILSELIFVAKKRPDLWAQFSGIVPMLDSKPAINPNSVQLLKLPTIVILFLLGCVLKDDSQSRAFYLVDVALSSSIKSHKKSVSDEDIKLFSMETPTAQRSLTQVLSLSVAEAFSFIVRFGCLGNTVDLRKVACSIVSKVCAYLDPVASGRLFGKLLYPISQVSALGKSSLELFTLLNDLIKNAGTDHVQASPASKFLLSSMRQYTLMTRYLEKQSMPRYEVSHCLYCSKGTVIKRSDKKVQDVFTSSSGSDRTKTVVSTYKCNSQEQISAGFSRTRLQDCCVSSCSDEFNIYSSLRYRLLISEFHLEVSDIRGRNAQTICFYYTPRPVHDVYQLKSISYVPVWQLCGTMTLLKGSNRGTLKLDKPVVAANIRIEYSSFYERPGSSTSLDGSFILYCPRCTRVVSNAHGVCGHCGEVCFQCRKCRHINYDRLDAFLCVECGYCSSGTFAYDLSAGIASNAICIRDDADFERSCRMLTIATRLHEDLHSILREQIEIDHHGNIGLGSLEIAPDLPASLQRATFGLLPIHSCDDTVSLTTLNQLGKLGSVVKAIALSCRHATGSGAANTASMMNRSQSLFRLTRAWRENEGRNVVGRSSSESMMINHVGGHIGSSSIHEHHLLLDPNESSEIFGLLEGAAAAASASGRELSAYSDDALSRILSTMQRRRERRTTTTDTTDTSHRDVVSTPSVRATGNPSADAASTTAIASNNSPSMSKEKVELCDRIYDLIREAEREANSLRLRISAWSRLESGSLLFGSSAEDFTMDAWKPPSTATPCSQCSYLVVLQLLQLWLTLFKMQPDHISISREDIQLLCTEDVNYRKAHSDVKLRALTEIAVHGRPDTAWLVYEVLRVRLLSASMTMTPSSVWYSEILEAIIRAGGPRPFSDLAMEILRSTATEMDLM